MYERRTELQHEKNRTFWHARPTTTQIKLRIRAVWSQYSLYTWRSCILGYPKCAQCRFWSDCANAQADLNLRNAHVWWYVFRRCGSVVLHVIIPTRSYVLSNTHFVCPITKAGCAVTEWMLCVFVVCYLRNWKNKEYFVKRVKSDIESNREKTTLQNFTFSED